MQNLISNFKYQTMKTIKLFILFILLTGFFSCEKTTDPPLSDITSITISNLYAPQSGGQGQPISGEFKKFDFATGQQTGSYTDWDIAFRGTSIIVNGGVSLGTVDEPNRSGQAAAYIVNGTFESVNEVNPNLLTQDSESGYAIATGSDNGWYNYSGAPSYLITPIPGKVLVFRTRDNFYAKVEILSYYENAPSDPDSSVHSSRFYTFNYIYQPNAGVLSF